MMIDFSTYYLYTIDLTSYIIKSAIDCGDFKYGGTNMLDKILKKNGELAKKYECIKNELLARVKEGIVRFYPKKWTGSYGRRRLVNKSYDYMWFAEAFGLDYKLGNDAPRGGVEGDYIDITLNDTFLKFWEEADNE